MAVLWVFKFDEKLIVEVGWICRSRLQVRMLKVVIQNLGPKEIETIFFLKLAFELSYVEGETKLSAYFGDRMGAYSQERL